MLKKRILTATVLSILTITGILKAPKFIIILILFSIFSVAAFEWAKLSGENNIFKKGIYSAFILVVSWFASHFKLQMEVCLLGMIFWFFSLILLLKFPENINLVKNKVFSFLVGFLVLVPALSSLEIILKQEQGRFLILFLLLCIWGVDIGAYFFGKYLGKSLLIPNVSPKKTWMGCLGGCFGVLLAFFTSYFFELNIFSNNFYIFVFLFFITYFSIVGDLVESIFKRAQNLKDSSNILPGHGGIMDRLDSLMSASVFFASFLFLGDSLAI